MTMHQTTTVRVPEGHRDPFTLLVESHRLKEARILGEISPEAYKVRLDALWNESKALESAMGEGTSRPCV